MKTTYPQLITVALLGFMAVSSSLDGNHNSAAAGALIMLCAGALWRDEA